MNKNVWFNNYGFFHNKTGKYVAGTDWMGTAFDESIAGAYSIVREELEKGIGL